MAYKQNTNYNDIVKNDEDTEETEENGGGTHGNTRLPFGLCAKYGIPLPEDATPRDAWDALKGKGIFPPWTDKGKDQYEGDDAIVDDTNEITDDGVKISPTRKETYEKVNKRLKDGKFTEQYQTTINDILMNLSDAEVEVFSLTDNVQLIHQNERSRQGSYVWGGTQVYCQETPRPVDKAMGYDVAMETFGHEYGHAVDYAYAKAHGGLFSGQKLSQLEDCKQAYNEDVLNYFNQACEDAGVKTMKSIDRITHDQKQAIWKRMKKDSGKDNTEIKFLSDFVKHSPSKPFIYPIYTDEQIQERADSFKRYSYGVSEDDVKGYISRMKKEREENIITNQKRNEEYNQSVKDYEEYQKTDDYKNGLAKYEQYKKNFDENKVKNDAKFERYGIISDFIGEITNGKFDVSSGGYYAHSRNYYKERAHNKGMETWATFFGMKTTRDVEGLNMMKTMLPKTYETYTKHYNELSKTLKGE